MRRCVLVAILNRSANHSNVFVVTCRNRLAMATFSASPLRRLPKCRRVPSRPSQVLRGDPLDFRRGRFPQFLSIMPGPGPGRHLLQQFLLQRYLAATLPTGPRLVNTIDRPLRSSLEANAPTVIFMIAQAGRKGRNGGKNGQTAEVPRDEDSCQVVCRGGQKYSFAL